MPRRMLTRPPPPTRLRCRSSISTSGSLMRTVPLPAAVAAAFHRAGCGTGGRRPLPHHRARRQSQRRSTAWPRPTPFRPSWSGRCRNAAAASRSPTPGSPATPPPAAGRASTGSWPASRSWSSSSWAATTPCAACRRRRPRPTSRRSSKRYASGASRRCSPACTRRATWGRSIIPSSTPFTPASPPATGSPSTPSSSPGWRARPELNQADGIHPNARGVAEIVRRILPLMVDTLGPQVCP